MKMHSFKIASYLKKKKMVKTDHRHGHINLYKIKGEKGK